MGMDMNESIGVLRQAEKLNNLAEKMNGFREAVATELGDMGEPTLALLVGGAIGRATLMVTDKASDVLLLAAEQKLKASLGREVA